MNIGDVGTTLLNLHGPGVPPYSARGLKQTLELIDGASHLERTINGELLDLGYAPFRKYKSTINGDDQQPPALDGVWPGTPITVDCIVEIAVKEDDYDELGRIAVMGSLRRENGFAIFRPRLNMMVASFTIDRDEYNAQTGWRLELEEA